MAGDIYVARKTAALVFNNRTVFIEEGSTMAREGHPILDVASEMFEPVFVHFEVDGDAEQSPEPAQQDTPPADAPAGKDTPPAPEQPSAKDVRAWAREQGMEVPTRGAVPQDVTDAYVAAHQGA